ncbi:MAG: transposase [Clostridia bacterium]|nr:transposase [Clostridia bacterium]
MYKLKVRQVSLFELAARAEGETELSRCAEKVPWDRTELLYKRKFPSGTGRPAAPLRLSLGFLLLREKTGLPDRVLLAELKSNVSYRLFLDLDAGSDRVPLSPSLLTVLRKRLDAEFLSAVNEMTVSAGQEQTEKSGDEPRAPMYRRTNSSREALEKTIDRLHAEFRPWRKGQTYRRVAQKEFLAVSGRGRKSAAAVGRYVRRDAARIKLDLRHIDRYLTAGYELTPAEADGVSKARELIAYLESPAAEADEAARSSSDTDGAQGPKDRLCASYRPGTGFVFGADRSYAGAGPVRADAKKNGGAAFEAALSDLIEKKGPDLSVILKSADPRDINAAAVRLLAANVFSDVTASR